MKINKSNLKYYLILTVLFLCLILVEIFKEKPIDWNFYLDRKTKSPYGTFLLYKCLPDIFHDVEENRKTLYTQFKRDMPTNTNLIIITEKLNIEKNELKTLKKYISNGNNAFLSAFYFSSEFADTFNIKTGINYSNHDSVNYKFTAPIFKNKPTSFGDKFENIYFEKDSLKNIIPLEHDDSDNITFLKMKYGKGNIYFHSRPDVFTNYSFVSAKKATYIFLVLSHLPNQKTFWDEYYKPFRKNKSNILSYIFSEEALSYAWYILIITSLVFIIVSSKRRQRIIPILENPKNYSIEFAKTLTNLYYNKKNHRKIAENKIEYFYHEISRKFFMPLHEINGQNVNLLVEKTNLNEKFWTKLFQMKSQIETQEININGNFLMQLEILLDEYYNQNVNK